MPLPDCIIGDCGKVSKAFLDKGITTFAEACLHVKNIPYGRNTDKDALLCVFEDNCGTCSTKHVLLKRLATENSLEIDLVTGIYKMDRNNTPGIGDTLNRYGLAYIPEAHNYMRRGNETFDYTFPHTKGTRMEGEVFEEAVIAPHEATTDKMAFHKSFLTKWLLANNSINLPLEEVWAIREECIAALSKTRDN